MKFEFSLTVKAVPTADCHLSIDCNADELAIMLADPVYQELGAKLVNEISFAPKQEQSQNHHDRVKDVERNLRRTLDKVVKNHDTQLGVMKHTIKVLEDRIASFKKRNPDFD